MINKMSSIILPASIISIGMLVCFAHASCQPNATAALWEHFGFKPNERGEPLSFVFFLFYIQMTTDHNPKACVLLSMAWM